jgi:ribonucleoside-diphosphate reductase beta chain
MKRLNTLSLSTQSDRLFFGESGHGIARYDVVRYPQLLKLNEKMQSFFWRPVEIDMSMEKKEFDRMTGAERFVFTSNLRRQIVLDSIQGRAPATAFLPWCTDPSLENAILTWSFFESIHSESYTHIIRALYPDPSEVFDGIPEIKEIADCATSVTAAYDLLATSPSKENLYLALMAANALEALRFYVSFACTFSFAERGLVEGSAKIVRMIARDENQHLALVQTVLKLLPKDDPDYIQIAGDLAPKALEIFRETAAQESEWASYLFKNGSVLGLSENILRNYVEYLFDRRTASLGLREAKLTRADHPLSWVEKWFKNQSVQVAPQEVELASYLSNSVFDDMAETKFVL